MCRGAITKSYVRCRTRISQLITELVTVITTPRVTVNDVTAWTTSLFQPAHSKQQRTSSKRSAIMKFSIAALTALLQTSNAFVVPSNKNARAFSTRVWMSTTEKAEDAKVSKKKQRLKIMKDESFFRRCVDTGYPNALFFFNDNTPLFVDAFEG